MIGSPKVKVMDRKGFQNWEKGLYNAEKGSPLLPTAQDWIRIHLLLIQLLFNIVHHVKRRQHNNNLLCVFNSDHFLHFGIFTAGCINNMLPHIGRNFFYFMC